MSKTVWITEKPSQGRDIASGLSSDFKKNDGFLENTDNIITWAFGHLIQLVEAHVYNESYKTWQIDKLPIIPQPFEYEISKDGYKQFQIIKNLITRKDVEKVVIACDPGREGELIARLILIKAENNKPVMRFWVTKALTPDVVKDGASHLKPAAEYDRLFHSAQSRQHADWLIGINATRAWTAKLGELHSLGRVQTPVLAMIVRRELEINNFIPKEFWTLQATFKHAEGEYTGNWFVKSDEEGENTGRFDDIGTAQKVADSIINKTGKVVEAKTQLKTENPPALFSLTELQKEANQLYGYSASDVLNIAQALYETHKVTSYPRTESQHLDSEMPKEVVKIIDNLTKYNQITFDKDKCTVDPKNKRIFDDTKLTDHHALIPNGELPKRLNEREQKIYDLIANRFIAAFYPPYKYNLTTVITDVENNSFKSSGRIQKDLGWKGVYTYSDNSKDSMLPPLKKGDAVTTEKADVKSGKTTPPSRYTEATILSAMQNAARFVTDEKLKKILKETSGIGTPATRAQIIETLKSRNFIELQKKYLYPTPKGISLINTVDTEKIADPAFTAYMEQELEEIAQGKGDQELFKQDIITYVNELIGKAKGLVGTNTIGTRDSVGKCPICGKDVFENRKAYSCSGYKEGCTFVLWKNCLSALGKPDIPHNIASALLDGKKITLKQLKGKSGKLFDAKGTLKQNEKGWSVGISFEN